MKKYFLELISYFGFLNCILFHHSDKMWTRLTVNQQKFFCCKCKREGIVP